MVKCMQTSMPPSLTILDVGNDSIEVSGRSTPRVNSMFDIYQVSMFVECVQYTVCASGNK